MSDHRTLLPLPIDPTPTWDTLSDRVVLAIHNLHRVLERGAALHDGLTGPQRVAVAHALNRHATPLVIALEAAMKGDPDAA